MLTRRNDDKVRDAAVLDLVYSLIDNAPAVVEAYPSGSEFTVTSVDFEKQEIGINVADPGRPEMGIRASRTRRHAAVA
jgi:hypothetical protein